MGIPEARFGFYFVNSILVVIDCYMRIAKFFPVSTMINAAELVHFFHNKIELKFGALKGIVSDYRPVFTSTFWRISAFYRH